jgi:hypothetical protein
MMMNKDFDTLEMKKRIQLGIYENTKNMTDEQLMAYFRDRVQASRFSKFFLEPSQNGLRMGLAMTSERQ